MTPTQRSLAVLRERGFLAEVVERWVPGANIRKDLFGFVDIVAVDPDGVLFVQTTSGDHVANRIAKIADHPNLPAVRAANVRIHVHGWRKSAAGRWVLREEDIS